MTRTEAENAILQKIIEIRDIVTEHTGEMPEGLSIYIGRSTYVGVITDAYSTEPVHDGINFWTYTNDGVMHHDR